MKFNKCIIGGVDNTLELDTVYLEGLVIYITAACGFAKKLDSRKPTGASLS